MNDLDVSQQIFRERHNLGKKIKKDRNYNNKKEKLNFQPLLQKLEIIEKRLAKLYLQANFSGFNLSLKDFLNYFEKNLIIRVLNYTRGNQKIASSILGIKVTTLNEKIKRYNIKINKKIIFYKIQNFEELNSRFRI